MYRVLDERTGDALEIKVDGTLTGEDYSVLIPFLERRIAEQGLFGLLCEMTNCDGLEFEAFWQDFIFSIRHLRDFQQMTIVGD